MGRPDFTQPVESPAAAAAREGYDDGLKSSQSDQTIASGNTPTYTVISSQDADGQAMLISSVEVTSNYDASVTVRLTIEDDQSNALYQIAGSVQRWPIQLEAQPIVPSGGSATVRVSNPTASEIDARIGHVWRRS